jgi:ATP-dependent Clp endopeptidase proteolytic subunit ClpP|nr:MAG TPA: Putative ATP dependent Clp protease [Caudoviricetes sp.]DAN16016.1 MAG TPA: Putative ATP dependent Clp protease [Bacteriophage sp.]
MNKFWNVKSDDTSKVAKLDLFGYVGGSKDDPWGKGFNEAEFLEDFRRIPEAADLEISINSFGGAVYTGLSIYSLLKAHKGSITFRIDGAAMSAATIITSVPNAKVIMPKGSMMMIHKVSSGVWGDTDDMRKMADDMEKLEDNIVVIYAEKSGRSVEEIKEKMNATTYFNAEEAVAFGLADEVDETVKVHNSAVGGFVNMNGLKVEAKYFSGMPQAFFEAETPKAAAVNKEVRMDLETLKADYPDLVEAIRKEARDEGAKAERSRMKDIEDCALPGYEQLVAEAKYGEKTMTGAELAVAIVKAEKATGKRRITDTAEDADCLNGITEDAGNLHGVDLPGEVNQEALDRIIAAGARGFEKK